MKNPKQYLVLSGGGAFYDPAVFTLQESNALHTVYSTGSFLEATFNHALNRFSIDDLNMSGSYILPPSGGLAFKIDEACSMCSHGDKPLAGSFHDTHEQAKDACRELGA